MVIDSFPLNLSDSFTHALACASLSPGLRSILVFDISPVALQQVAQTLSAMLKTVTGWEIVPVSLGTFESEDDLWGCLGLWSESEKQPLHWQPGLLGGGQKGSDLRLVVIPDLTKLSIAASRACVMLMGADVHRREILHTFWTQAGGSEAMIAIIPSASREPTLIGDRYQTIFEEMGAKDVRVLDIRDRAQGEDPFFQEYIEECTGVFLTGGDQLRLCGLLADTPLMERVRQRVRLGEITLAGTSVGPMVMGHHMIAGGGSNESPNRALVDMAMGLSIIPEVIVDSHFFNRNRMARLLSVMAIHPERLGIGIDEDTCAMFELDGMIQVIGRGAVTIIDAREMSYTKWSQLDLIRSGVAL